MPDPQKNSPSPQAVQEPDFPVLPRGGPMIDFNLRDASRDDVETIDVFISSRIPGEYVRYYGGMVDQAAFMAAIDQKSGEVFIADCSRPHTVPLDMERLQRLPEPKPGDPAIVSAEDKFSVNLPGQLGLPADGGDYLVLVWIDAIVSKVKPVTVPPDPNRRGARPRHVLPAALSPVRLERQEKTPPAEAGQISLVGSFEEQPFGIGHLYGAVGQGVVPKGPGRFFLTLLASTFDTREATGLSTIIPAEPHPNDGFPFDVEAGSLFPAPAERRKTFCLAVFGRTVSAVAMVEPRR